MHDGRRKRPEILAVPVVQRREMQLVGAGVVAQPAIVRVHVLRLRGQLFVQAFAHVSLGAQRRAADGRAHEREMDARLGELRPDLVVFDLIQAPSGAGERPPDVFPTLVLGDVTDRRDRAMVEDEPQRERVVRVGPAGHRRRHRGIGRRRWRRRSGRQSRARRASSPGRRLPQHRLRSLESADSLGARHWRGQPGAPAGDCARRPGRGLSRRDAAHAGPPPPHRAP